MTEPVADRERVPRAPPSLQDALRLARLDAAEQSDVIAQFRQTARLRLEILRDALQPVLQQVPQDIDLFDIGLTGGDNPRLFIDMIGFVDLGEDHRQYRFLQDTRHGRIRILETAHLDDMVAAITHYMAQRLIEREKALASDKPLERAGETYIQAQLARPQFAAPKDEPAQRPSGGVLRFFRDAVVIAALGAMIWAAAYRGVPVLHQKFFTSPEAVTAAH